jgi:hypothetical protein
MKKFEQQSTAFFAKPDCMVSPFTLFITQLIQAR